MPDGTAEPTQAVIVLPSMFGVNDHARQVARHLARAGYLAIVPHVLREHIRPEANAERISVIAMAGRIATQGQFVTDVAANRRRVSIGSLVTLKKLKNQGLHRPG